MDNWSLKGLKQKKIDYVDKSVDIPYFVYREECIDTLREKLIKDLHFWWFNNSEEVMEVEDLDKIIEKRFGNE